MLISERLRRLRIEHGFSQGDIERATGLLRCYISRVEHGHTEPSLGTLEKFAMALQVPLYQLFCESDAPGTHRHKNRLKGSFAGELARLAGRMSQGDRALLMRIAETMARRQDGAHLPRGSPQTDSNRVT